MRRWAEDHGQGYHTGTTVVHTLVWGTRSCVTKMQHTSGEQAMAHADDETELRPLFRLQLWATLFTEL